MENLGIFWNKNKEEYSSKVQSFAQYSGGHYYCSGYLRKATVRSKPFEVNSGTEVFKLLAPVEFTKWET